MTLVIHGVRGDGLRRADWVGRLKASIERARIQPLFAQV